jgi:hypothetical protein
MKGYGHQTSGLHLSFLQIKPQDWCFESEVLKNLFYLYTLYIVCRFISAMFESLLVFCSWTVLLWDSWKNVRRGSEDRPFSGLVLPVDETINAEKLSVSGNRASRHRITTCRVRDFRNWIAPTASSLDSPPPPPPDWIVSIIIDTMFAPWCRIPSQISSRSRSSFLPVRDTPISACTVQLSLQWILLFAYRLSLVTFRTSVFHSTPTMDRDPHLWVSLDISRSSCQSRVRPPYTVCRKAWWAYPRLHWSAFS